MHEGHRQRLRQRFIDYGLDGFSNHNILELVLFNTIPRRDTNEIAHNLIDTFGSFSAVFDASYEDLIKVEGVGETTATLLNLLVPVYGKYLEDKQSNCNIITSSEDAGKCLVAKFIGAKNETVMLLCMDNKGYVKNCEVLSQGSLTMTEITARKIVECAFKNNATAVILAHNHPNGFAVPSSADVEVTRNIIKILNSIDVRLKDHIIVANNEYFSMADNAKFSLMFS